MTLTRALPLKDDPGLVPSANTMAFHIVCAPFLHLVCAPFSLRNQVQSDGKTPKQLQRDKKWQTASVCVCVCVCKSEREREEYRSINGEWAEGSRNREAITSLILFMNV